MTTTLTESLAATLDDLKHQIRQQPADPKLRIFLFQLLTVLGDWQKAQNQLTVCGELDDANLAMMHVYRAALQCEAFRAEVFQGKRQPVVFGEPASWIAALIESLRLEQQSQWQAAQQLRAAAFEEAPGTPGQLTMGHGDVVPFDWIADADGRLGPMLEALVEGKYYWISWQHIRAIDIEAPHDLRDFVWTPVVFTWTTGGQSAGFIPTRYAGSEHAQEDALRMARRTEWEAQPSGAHWGLGQRMFATDRDEYALLDVRRIELTSPAADRGQATQETGAETGDRG